MEKTYERLVEEAVEELVTPEALRELSRRLNVKAEELEEDE